MDRGGQTVGLLEIAHVGDVEHLHVVVPLVESVESRDPLECHPPQPVLQPQQRDLRDPPGWREQELIGEFVSDQLPAHLVYERGEGPPFLGVLHAQQERSAVHDAVRHDDGIVVRGGLAQHPDLEFAARIIVVLEEDRLRDAHDPGGIPPNVDVALPLHVVEFCAEALGVLEETRRKGGRSEQDIGSTDRHAVRRRVPFVAILEQHPRLRMHQSDSKRQSPPISARLHPAGEVLVGQVQQVLAQAANPVLSDAAPNPERLADQRREAFHDRGSGQGCRNDVGIAG